MSKSSEEVSTRRDVSLVMMRVRKNAVSRSAFSGRFFAGNVKQPSLSAEKSGKLSRSPEKWVFAVWDFRGYDSLLVTAVLEVPTLSQMNNLELDQADSHFDFIFA